MEEKIKAIKEYFLTNGYVYLSKQCRKEYIVYFFSANSERNAVIRKNKQHFKTKDSEGGKIKHRIVYISLDKFFNNTVFKLIRRGYDLELFNK